MLKYFTKFDTQAEYDEAKYELDYPNVSIVASSVTYTETMPTPPTPTIQTKWIATYSDSHTESAQCDASSAITQGEITLDNLVSVQLGDCVTEIGDGTFQECSSLTGITIPSSVTSIGYGAFGGCGFTSITISDSVTNIGGYAFAYCYNLTSVTIPNSVTSIDDFAFTECTSLTSITVNATTPPTLGGAAFDNTNNCPIYVPASSVSAYQSASGWSDYASRIQAIPTPLQGKWLATYTGGTTSSAECDASSAITGGEITLTDLVSVQLGDCVTEIGDEAFYGCSSLTGITIPSSVTSIGFDAFRDCSSLPVENNIRYADTYLVEAVDKTLSTYTIKNGTRWIAPIAFSECSSLTDITIPDSVTSIGNIAFSYCSDLTSVTIPSGVTEIGRQAFAYCINLTSVTVNAETPPTLRGYGESFDNTNNCPIYVPAASLSQYQSAEKWSVYADRIQPIQ